MANLNGFKRNFSFYSLKTSLEPATDLEIKDFRKNGLKKKINK